MRVEPTHVEHSGPGIDLSNLADGLSIRMSDPVEDFKYARNAVTLLYNLADYEQVHLAFEAMEFGDEPHAPPPSPFGDDVNFDGVAISTDGTNWYEVQDLRSLRSDRFTQYEIDLDAAAAGWGLSLDGELQIRFCQYDNNPAPMDGVFLHGIEVTGDLTGPVFNLPMDDSDVTPTVRDISDGGVDQTFIDPTGDPNTAAHGAAGPNGGLALSFDGVDDRIDFGETLLGDVVAAGRDFSICFWIRTDDDPGSPGRVFLRREGNATDPKIRMSMADGRISWLVGWGVGYVMLYSQSGILDDQWHHITCRRQGQTLSLWVDGIVRDTQTDPNYAGSLFGPWSLRALGHVYSNIESWPFAMAQFLVYRRGLSDDEIAALG